MKRTEQIRKIYTILISVFIVATAVALICVAADIYYSGGAAQGAYTRAKVAKRLTAMAIPLIVLIGAIAAGAIFPAIEVRAKRTNEDKLKLLAKKIPAGGDGEFEKAKENFRKLGMYRLIVWGAAGVVVLACTVAVLCYVLRTANFKGEDFTKEIFAMTRFVLPFVLAMFAAMIAAAVAGGVLAGKQVKEAKTLIKHGAGAAESKGGGALAAVQGVLSSSKTLWIVRAVVFAVAVTFVVLGICNGGARAVMVTATELCKACIGIG